MKSENIRKMAVSALLCAIGIVIPMFSPLKVVMPPASFTFGSHIAIFIAVFMAPSIAVSVSIVTALGFFLGAFPIDIVCRAATHVIFALIGATVLKKAPSILNSFAKSQIFSFCIGLIHALCEVAIVTVLYVGNLMRNSLYYEKGYFFTVVILVGVGTVIHSMIDFAISLSIWRILKLNKKAGGA